MKDKMRMTIKLKSTWLGYLALGLLTGIVSACAVHNDEPTHTPETEQATPKSTRATSPVAEALDHQALLDSILYTQLSSEQAQSILTPIGDSGDTRFVAGLIDTLRYRRDLASDIARTLNALTGQDLPPDWFEWVEWAGKHPEIESFSDYPAWKARLFSNIDPNFLRFLYPGVKIAPDSRVEEIVWGGVTVDGIPALDNPTMIAPKEADYLEPHERVFGVSINGDTRAYPARFLDWHEMFNDIVGGEPVSLAY
jgi:hypothetical protein